jgi:hypothetical protein
MANNLCFLIERSQLIESVTPKTCAMEAIPSGENHTAWTA